MASKRKSRVFLISVLCGLVGVAIYSNTTDLGLCYDDQPAIKENLDLRPNESWTNLLSNDFWGQPMKNNNSHKSYRPLCVATFRLNYLLHELQPMGYHLVNILLHGVVCYLYVQLCSLVLSEVWPALIAGLLFAVHPIHTEAVASVVGRAECLAGLFFMLALLCYHQATRAGAASYWLLLSVLCCSCATLSKETGITVLAVCVVYDVCIVNQLDLQSAINLLRSVKRKRPAWLKGMTLRLMVLIVFGLVFTLLRLKLNNGLPNFGMHDNPGTHLSSPWRQLHWLHLCFINVWLILNPFPLSCDWRVGAVPSINSLINPWNLATAATLLSVMGLGFYSISGKLKHGSQVVFALSLMVFPYLPASNLFFPVGFVVAERVLYLPSMGLCLLVAYGVWQIIQSFQTKHFRWFLHSAVVCLLLSYSLKTYQRNRDWYSNHDLFLSAIRTFPRNALMLNNIGSELVKGGNMSQAVALFRSSVSAAPHIALTHFSLAKALMDSKEYDESEQYFTSAMEVVKEEQSAELAAKIYSEYGNLLTRDSNLHNRSALTMALRLWESAHRMVPDKIDYAHNKGYGLLKLGRNQEAKDVFESVLAKSPDHYGANYKLGEALLGLGQAQEAEFQFRKVLTINESDILTKFQVAGIILNRAHPDNAQLEDAQQMLQDVIAAEPTNDKALFALGVAYHQHKKLHSAEQLFLRALAANSSHPGALYNLGLMYVQAHRYAEAKEQLTQLLHLQPSHAQALMQLANCHAYQGDFEPAVELYERSVQASNGRPDWNTLSNYGVVQRELGRLKEAEDLFLSALSVSGVNERVVMRELNTTRSLMSSSR